MIDTDVDRECRSLLGLCIKLGESLKGRKPDNFKLRNSEFVAQKVIFHACSILFLFRGTNLDGVPLLDKPTNFVDYASIHVLTRSLLETTWAFHHVFVEPETEDERSFRYYCWMLAGFVQRPTFPAITQSARQQLDKDVAKIAEWREELGRTEAFARLRNPEKTKALEGRLWRPPSFKQTAKKFLGSEFGPSIYGYLSSYQHADALAAVQIGVHNSYEKQRAAARTSLSLVAISLSNLIEAYSTLWPGLKLVANGYPDIQELVEMYSSFGAFEATG